MAKESAKTKSQTLSVGETAKRLDVSPDSVRNYCERGSLRFLRLRGSHRRVLLRSIEAFEAQRRPNKLDASRTTSGSLPATSFPGPTNLQNIASHPPTISTNGF